ncbi:MAG: phosphoribosylformylglycinamidine cyclo-ligase [Armatimonadetes bacterium]|nr:phosphoribosylformylglycinamidine cyclo-ligase [Armatimonadota bacterium]
MSEHSLTYSAAGVHIDEAQRVLRNVIPEIRQTHNEQVMASIGGFGAMFSGQFPGIERPVLVSSIDGVGTKTRVAAMAGDFSGIGMDLVNHCVNDILCQGAKPLFFLDYYGCSHIHSEVFEAIVRGMVQSCSSVNCALIGGETAELPGTYVDDEVDIVGTIVGVVDADQKLPRPKMKAGDFVIGLASDGLHTNGYSLARKAIFEVGGMSVRDAMPGLSTTIGEELLRPHRCYYNSIYPILQDSPDIYAMAHITGGGLTDNIPRVLPSDIKVVLERRSWSVLPIFNLIQDIAHVPWPEMYKTFNCGIGMVLIVNRDVAPAIVQRLNQAGETAMVIGEVQRGGQEVQIV